MVGRREGGRKYPDVEQHQTDDDEDGSQRSAPSESAGVVGEENWERYEEGEQQLHPEDDGIGIEHEVVQNVQFHFQPAVPIGDEEGKQVVGVQKR